MQRPGRSGGHAPQASVTGIPSMRTQDVTEMIFAHHSDVDASGFLTTSQDLQD